MLSEGEILNDVNFSFGLSVSFFLRSHSFEQGCGVGVRSRSPEFADFSPESEPEK